MSWLTDEKSVRFWSLELTGNRYSNGLPELNTDVVVADAVRAGANVLVCFGLGHRCYAYFPSRYFPHHPQLSGRNVIGELITKSKRAGIHFVSYNCSHSISPVLARKHPDWCVQYHPACKQADGCFPSEKSLCPLSPFYEEVYMPAIGEQIEMGIEGLFFDGIGGWKDCDCPFCRRAYREMTNDKTPLRKVPLTMLREWGERVAERNAGKMVDFIKSKNPECVVFANGIFGGGKKLREVADAMGTEAFGHVNFRILPPFDDATYVGKMLKAVSRPDQRTIVYSRFAQYPWTHIPNSKIELQLAAYQTVASGACVWYSAYDTGVDHYKEAIADIGEASAFIEKIKDHTSQAEEKARVAILDRDDVSHDFYLFSRPSRAFAELFLTAHVPYDVLAVNFLNPDKLKQYELIIVPEIRRMSNAVIQLLDRYRRAGGKLMWIYDAGREDETGRRRQSLPSSFGFRFLPAEICCKTEHDATYLFVEESHPYMKPFRGRSILPNGRRCQCVKPLRGSEILGRIEDRDMSSCYTMFRGVTKYPAILLNRERDVMYLAGDVGTIYQKGHNIWLKRVLLHLLESLAGHSLRLNTNAPESVGITLFRQERKRALYLINSASVVKRPIDEIVPVYDITITLDGTFRRVYSMRGEKVTVRRKAGKTSVTLPHLEICDCVVLEP